MLRTPIVRRLGTHMSTAAYTSDWMAHLATAGLVSDFCAAAAVVPGLGPAHVGLYAGFLADSDWGNLS